MPLEWIDTGNGRHILVDTDKLSPKEDKSANFDMPEFNIKGKEFIHGKGYTIARQVPLGHPEAPRHDSMGRAIFVNEAEKREFAARTGASNDGRAIEDDSSPTPSDKLPMPHDKEVEDAKAWARENGYLPRIAKGKSPDTAAPGEIEPLPEVRRRHKKKRGK